MVKFCELSIVPNSGNALLLWVNRNVSCLILCESIIRVEKVSCNFLPGNRNETSVLITSCLYSPRMKYGLINHNLKCISPLKL